MVARVYLAYIPEATVPTSTEGREPTMKNRAITSTLLGLLTLTVAMTAEGQVTPAAAGPNFLAVGAQAPSVSFTGATRWGVLGQPVTLEQFRGKTVILAFFPAARTRGCTIQMQTYREEYERVFNSGREVVLIAISNDPPEDLLSWAQDEDFPFLFGSDPDGALYRAFGGVPGGGGRFGRTVIALDREGKVAEVVDRFLEVDPTSYDHLQATVARLSTVE